MNDKEKFVLLRTLLGCGISEDAVLTAYLKLAGQKIIDKAFPFDKTVFEVPSEYAVLQCEIAQYLYNKQGAEGEVSHDENGIKRTYESGGVPDSMLKSVIPYGGIPK